MKPKKLYMCSYFAMRGKDIYHASSYVVAESKQLATGAFYELMMNKCPSQDGWYNHSMAIGDGMLLADILDLFNN